MPSLVKHCGTKPFFLSLCFLLSYKTSTDPIKYWMDFSSRSYHIFVKLSAFFYSSTYSIRFLSIFFLPCCFCRDVAKAYSLSFSVLFLCSSIFSKVVSCFHVANEEKRTIKIELQFFFVEKVYTFPLNTIRETL